MSSRIETLGDVARGTGHPATSEKATFEDLLRQHGIGSRADQFVEEQIRSRYEEDIAVLVLDSSGCTRITRRFGIIHFMSMIMAMRDFVNPVMTAHSSLAHWAAADNIFAMFPTAEQAVHCARAIHAGMPDFNRQYVGPEPLRVCIGVGTGRLLRIGIEDVFGDEMNLASKLGEDVAGPEELLITESTYERVKNTIEDVTYEPHRIDLSGLEISYYCVRY